MVIVPAAGWRGGSLQRGVTLGVGAGLGFGALAWLDSGLLFIGAIVAVILGVGAGVWMARQMSRYWPGASELSGAQRIAVVTATRRGDRIGDASLAPAVVDYGTGLHAAADKGKPWRWVIVFVLVVAIAVALWDAFYGSWGSAVVSAIYLVFLGVEVFWWPRRQAELLANADKAVAQAREAELPN